eukprot:Rhum_TRINITY_DN14314_c7_g3::Rhum_TRINITY_DN14314_c7_g3_i1::g.80629::m.80629
MRIYVLWGTEEEEVEISEKQITYGDVKSAAWEALSPRVDVESLVLTLPGGSEDAHDRSPHALCDGDRVVLSASDKAVALQALCDGMYELSYSGHMGAKAAGDTQACAWYEAAGITTPDDEGIPDGIFDLPDSPVDLNPSHSPLVDNVVFTRPRPWWRRLFR